MTSELTFTRVTPADRETLEGLVRDYYAYDGHDYVEAEQGPALDLVCQGAANSLAWLIHGGGELAGYLILTTGFSVEYGGTDGFIDELHLVEAFRGRGLGAHVMDFAEKAGRQAGIRYLHLEVEIHNARARRLYDGRGYVDSERTLMSKRLVE
ncbi:N-acetyltransferase [Parvibaculum sp.]|uniref:GNAT family N-acetyltransferase n=1 Tax=Parvibaculum sp. TaxID=2024848 RepID=UPI001B2A3062|nr:N-acetyltransferase [Parvibaculum sp.]MBO6633743.1 GNAT family N-acetyltransferase [Parvibaculum sp.]MBO6677027.1 GNAT family N-acetyltransferase [Parvibaculum sp.]MBO6683449.1 GNAT family N-acetyltransferase [Parvibaculum sp.]MBO6904826.1 GNAT family N-acetyltransferase [Parvibaculum sp.]